MKGKERGKIRVALVNQPWNNVVPPVRSGSIAIWTYEVARRLAEYHDVIVYGKKSLKDRYKLDNGVLYRYFRTGLDTKLYRLFRRFPNLFNREVPVFASPLYYFGYIFQVAMDLRRRQYDIVHLPNFSQFVPIIRALNPKIKIALHMHCEWLTQLPYRTVQKRLESVDLILGCSEYITGKISTCFPQYKAYCHSVYNGVDIKQFTPKGKGTRRDIGDVLRLIYVGRISPEKGLHVLIDAFKKVVVHFANVELWIVGQEALASREFLIDLSDDDRIKKLSVFYDGESYLQRVKQQIPLNLRNKVKFTGFVPHPNLHQYYSLADVLVNPSISESFGMSLIEAMASGIPVIATSAGGQKEIVIPGRTGYCVEPDNVQEMAEAILNLLMDAELRARMAKDARHTAVNMYSWEKICTSLTRLYNIVL